MTSSEVSGEYRLSGWRHARAVFATLGVPFPLGPTMLVLAVLGATTVASASEPFAAWRLLPWFALLVLAVPTLVWLARYGVLRTRFGLTIRVTVDDAGIEFATPRFRNAFPWSTVRAVRERAGFLLVYVTPFTAFAIPVEPGTYLVRHAIEAQHERRNPRRSRGSEEWPG